MVRTAISCIPSIRPSPTIIAAVRAEWPDRKPLSPCVAAEDFQEGGWTLDDAIAPPVATVLAPSRFLRVPIATTERLAATNAALAPDARRHADVEPAPAKTDGR